MNYHDALTFQRWIMMMKANLTNASCHDRVGVAASASLSSVAVALHRARGARSIASVRISAETPRGILCAGILVTLLVYH